MQGIIGGFANGDPSAIQRRRAGDPFAALLAGLGVRVWLDAHDGTYLSTTGALIDTAIDRSGSGLDATASGSLRPTFDGSLFGGRGGIAFDGSLQRLLTASFLCQPDTSGCVYWQYGAGPEQVVVDFGPDNHLMIFAFSDDLTVRAGSVDTQRSSPSSPMRVTWRTSTAGVTRILYNGAQVLGAAVSTASAQTSTLRVSGTFAGAARMLAGSALGELVFADVAWSNAQMDAVDAALAQRW